MLKFSIVGLHGKEIKAAVNAALKNGFVPSKKPDFAIVIGGHGTVYFSEKKLPSVPKLLVRPENILDFPDAIKRVSQGKYKIREIGKIKMSIRGKALEAMNDITVRNKGVEHAIRFVIKYGNKKKFVVADGVVASTSYGSTGYFNSVCRKGFKGGYGLAFNNSMEKIRPFFFSKGRIVLRIERGVAEATADSSNNVITMRKGDSVSITPSEKRVRLIDTGIDLFRRSDFP